MSRIAIAIWINDYFFFFSFFFFLFWVVGVGVGVVGWGGGWWWRWVGLGEGWGGRGGGGGGGGGADCNITEIWWPDFHEICRIGRAWHKGNICWARVFHSPLECFTLLKPDAATIWALVVLIVVMFSIVKLYQYRICLHPVSPGQDSHHKIAWNQYKTSIISVRWTHQIAKKPKGCWATAL